MSIVRTERKGDFTVIPNELINDADLDGDALGLLVFLLSKPADWWVKVEALSGIKRFGAHGKVVKTLQTLRTLGYATLTRMSSGHTEWVITDYRQQSQQNHHIPKSGMGECEPHSENPNVAFPNVAFRHVLQKKDLDKELNQTKDYPPLGEPSETAKPAKQDGPPDRLTDPVSRQLWGHPLPFDFIVPDNWIQAVVAMHGCSTATAQAEAEAFAEYWANGKGRNQTRLDWRKTWMVWCAKPYALNEPKQAAQTQQTSRKTIGEQNREAAIRAKAMLFGNNNVLEGECSHA